MSWFRVCFCLVKVVLYVTASTYPYRLPGTFLTTRQGSNADLSRDKATDAFYCDGSVILPDPDALTYAKLVKEKGAKVFRRMITIVSAGSDCRITVEKGVAKLAQPGAAAISELSLRSICGFQHGQQAVSLLSIGVPARWLVLSTACGRELAPTLKPPTPSLIPLSVTPQVAWYWATLTSHGRCAEGTWLGSGQNLTNCQAGCSKLFVAFLQVNGNCQCEDTCTPTTEGAPDSRGYYIYRRTPLPTPLPTTSPTPSPTPSPTQATYVITSEEGAACPGGWTDIMSKAECDKAMTAFRKNAFEGGEHSWSTDVTGCLNLYDHRDKMTFNKHPIGGSHGYKVCVQACSTVACNSFTSADACQLGSNACDNLACEWSGSSCEACSTVVCNSFTSADACQLGSNACDNLACEWSGSSCEATYVITSEEGAACPGGWTDIMSKAECDKAMTAFRKNAFEGGEHSWSTDVTGCLNLYDHRDKMTFNKHPIGGSHGYKVCVPA